MIIKVLTATASNTRRYVYVKWTLMLGKFKMERGLNFEGMISHLFLKAKQPNDHYEKTLSPRFIKTVKK